MGEVAALDDYRPTMQGPATCLDCGHRWEAVAPPGTVTMTCKSCGLDKGVWVGTFLPRMRTSGSAGVATSIFS